MKKLLLLLLLPFVSYGQGSWINVQLQLDQFPSETQWMLQNINGDTLIYQNPMGAYGLVDEIYNLPADTFIVTVMDIFGDGICGSIYGGGDGWFLVQNNCQDTLSYVYGCDFDTLYVDTLIIAACAPPVYGCTDITADNFNPFSNLDDGSCIVTDCDPVLESQITIILTLDDYPNETSWILTDISNGQPLATGGGYGFADKNKTFQYVVCSPTTGYELILSDSYGDGLGGSTTGGTLDGDCRIMGCTPGDTLWQLPAPNFGYTAYSGATWPTPCAPPPPVYGCMDDDYLEYDPLATLDNGSCFTLHTYGCTDALAFNYDSSATMMSLEPYCNYWLTLEDDAGDGWGNSYLGVIQGDNLQRIFRLGPGVYSQSFWLDSLRTDDDIEIYYFEVSAGQQTPAEVSFQTLHNSFTLINDYGDTLLAEGTNPFYNNGQGALQNFEAPDYNIYNAVPFCGDFCIETVYGCMDSTALNYVDSANVDDGGCIAIVLGCTNPLAFNYNALANVDDSSCVTTIIGCMDTTAFNYNPLANVNDSSSCIPVILGCMDNTMFNYDASANTSDGSCIPFVYGCTDAFAFNYDVFANTDDGSCVPVILGCTDVTAFNYDNLANTDDGNCIPYIYGCTDATMFNYCQPCNTDNGTCIPFNYGCTDSTQYNYDPFANTDNGSCIPYIYGCTNPLAINFDPLANTNDFSCILPIYGCMDSTAFNYNPLANVDNGSCVPVIYGCTDPMALNYCDSCNTDDFSCITAIYGCTDSTMFNYNPLANVNNNTCVPFVYGCTDPSMLNYSPQANTEDFSCIAYVYGCMDSLALNYDPLANTDNGSCVTSVMGCMDQTAYNYNGNANINDSLSCLYSAGCITGDSIPYWLNDPCYAWVIDIDNYCCNNEWDEICQSMYNYCDNSWTGPVLSREEALIVYPNPTSSTININKSVNAVIYNNLGDVIISKNNTSVLDVSKISPGAYVLRIEYKEKIIYKKIIKE